jgi:Uma2 family endonuclease
MSTAPAKRRRADRIILRGVNWAEYSRYLRAFAERPRIRLTYNRGVLEIMSPLPEHEFFAEILGRFLVILSEELNLPVRAGGSTTLRRRRHRRGLEPDKCWWIANAPRLQGRIHIDLRTDPPPDLAVEVDVTSSSLPRMAIYASLSVPEVWRIDNGVLTFHILDAATGAYQVQPYSLAFPLLASADLVPFLAQVGQVDDTVLGLQFRAWLRQRLASQSSSALQP